MINRYLGIICLMFGVYATALCTTYTWNDLGTTSLSSIAAKVADGDTVLITGGNSQSGACVWSRNNLLIKGIGGTVQFSEAITDDQKGIFEITGNNCVIDNITFANIINASAGTDSNAAGIYFTGTNLTVINCSVNNCYNGIYATNNLNSTVTIVNSIFEYNGFGNNVSYNVYVGTCKQFIMRGCYVHGANATPNVESGAYATVLEYNRISDDTLLGSYPLCVFPNGGTVALIGNILQRSNASSSFGGNHVFVEFTVPGFPLNPLSSLFFVNNTIINQLNSSGDYVAYPSGYTADTLVLINNLVVGPASALIISAQHRPTTYDTLTNLFMNSFPAAGLQDYAHFDYHLTAASPAINAGTSTGLPAGAALLPTQEFAPPDSTVPRAIVEKKIDIGAYEYPTPLAVKENSAIISGDAMRLYPNPATNTTSLAFRAASAFARIDLINQSGATVLHTTRATQIGELQSFALDTHELPAGTYFALVQSGISVVVKMLTVVR